MNKCKKKWLLKRMWYNDGGKAMYVDEKVSALALLLRKKPKKKKFHYFSYRRVVTLARESLQKLPSQL